MLVDTHGRQDLFVLLGEGGADGVTLDGNSDYVDCGNPSHLNFTESDAFSVSAWFDLSPTANFPQIVGKSGGSSQGYDLFHNNDDTFQVRVKDASNALTVSSTATIVDGWHHGVLVYDGSNTLTGYLNGESFGTDSSPVLSGLDVSVSNLQIGYVSQYINGTISGVKIWDRELSAAEVLELYNRGRK